MTAVTGSCKKPASKNASICVISGCLVFCFHNCIHGVCINLSSPHPAPPAEGADWRMAAHQWENTSRKRQLVRCVSDGEGQGPRQIPRRFREHGAFTKEKNLSFSLREEEHVHPDMRTSSAVLPCSSGG